MSATDTTPIKFRWYFSVAITLFIFVVVGVYSSQMANNNTSGYDEQQAQIRKAKLDKMQDTDRKTLTTADWIDKDKGIVRIPIDEAMTEEVGVLKAKAPAMGSALPVAAPVAPAAPAASTPAATNAAPATPSPTK